MTDAEMTEAVRLARAFDEANSSVMLMSHALTIARALIESRRQVEALQAAWEFADHVAALKLFERDAATARAERAERERDDAIRTAVDHQRINNSLTVKLDEYLTGRKVKAMLATERARVVEAIHPSVLRVEERSVEWSDDHPLNLRDKTAGVVAELFDQKVQP